MFDHDLVLKSDELFMVGDRSTEHSAHRASGLYFQDTRHLNRFDVSLGGVAPDILSTRLHDASTATITAANGLIELPGGDFLFPHRVLVEQHLALDSALHINLVLQNFSMSTLQLVLELEFAADFRDLFDIRGFPHGLLGSPIRPSAAEREVTLGYEARDGTIAATAIKFDSNASITILRGPSTGQDSVISLLPGHDRVTWEPAQADVAGGIAAFPVALAPSQRWNLSITVTPQAQDKVRPRLVTNATDRINRRARIETDNPFFNRAFAQSDRDLESLLTTFPEGRLPAAGIPWYVAPFGRDSLITGLQTYHLMPEQAKETLRVLASLQGREINDFREEQPGKILHEMRYGEMARTHEIPHSPYYGSLDSTPLFIWLFAETVAWTGDDRLYDDLLPNVRRALAWFNEFGDLDGDGLLEYQTGNEGTGKIRHPVWKDSFDSLNYPDGRPVEGKITPLEVQGYAFAAYLRLAEVVRHHGAEDPAAELRAKAEVIRLRVEELFWMEEEGTYAQAIDNDKKPVMAIASNAGQLLFCELPSAERAKLVMERLFRADMNSGWGIRTLSAGEASYNPMSYHNGSVWPHDNSLIAAGSYRYGLSEYGHAIATALFDAGSVIQLERLPELFCGFERLFGGADAPVPYPVSCSPQAWSAGVYALLVRSMLGLKVDIGQRTLAISPDLPDWLREITISNLQVLGQQGDIRVVRDGDGFSVETNRLLVSS